MAEWRETTLDQVVELRRGFDLPTHSRIDGPVPVLSAGSRAGWHNEIGVRGPGMVVGRATNLGVPTWSEVDFWPLNTTLYAADFRANEPKWVYHLFEFMDFTGFDSGSVQPMLNRNYIAKVKVRVPDLATQRAIAEVLGALDDKIAANTKLAATADLLAQHEFERVVRGVNAGPSTYADVARVGGGGTPRSTVPEYWDGNVQWLTPTDVTALSGPYISSTGRTITEAGLSSISSVLYPVGSIFMTSRATIGAFALAEAPMAVNQGFIVVQPNDGRLRYWLFHEMRHRVPEFLDHANGATFMELSRGNFKKLPVRLAAREEMYAFNETAGRLHDRGSAALRENRRLAAARDALLPALMSGELRVRDAERVAAENPSAAVEMLESEEQRLF